MKKTVPKTRNCGRWSEAQYRGWIRGLLRGGSLMWGPRAEALAKAFVKHGINPKTGRKCKLHRCSTCGTLSVVSDLRVDHIKPIIDPQVGFTTWDDFIRNLFCEVDNLQAVCVPCHDRKTRAERMVASGTIAHKAVRPRSRG